MVSYSRTPSKLHIDLHVDASKNDIDELFSTIYNDKIVHFDDMDNAISSDVDDLFYQNLVTDFCLDSHTEGNRQCTRFYRDRFAHFAACLKTMGHCVIKTRQYDV